MARFVTTGAEAFDFTTIQPKGDGRARTVYDGDVVVGTESDDGFVTEDSSQGKLLRSWLDRGVPGYRGEIRDGVAMEVSIIVTPEQPMFGLALQEEIERRGWRIVEDQRGEPAVMSGAKEFAEEQHPRDDHGRWTGTGGATVTGSEAGQSQGGTGWGGKPADNGHFWLPGYKPHADQGKPKPEFPSKPKPPPVPDMHPDHAAIGKVAVNAPEIEFADLSAEAIHANVPGWAEPPKWDRRTYGGVLFNEKGEVLLREPSNHWDGYHWTFAKGMMDSKDEHPVDTAMNEVEEETGHVGEIIAAVPGAFGRTVYYEPNPKHPDWDVPPPETWRNYYFIMRSVSHDPSYQDKETQSTRWATYEDAIKLISEGTNHGGVDRDLKVLRAAYREMSRLSGGKQGKSIFIPCEDARTKDYREEDHPRDEHGRWTSGGGGEEASRDQSREGQGKWVKDDGANGWVYYAPGSNVPVYTYTTTDKHPELYGGLVPVHVISTGELIHVNPVTGFMATEQEKIDAAAKENAKDEAAKYAEQDGSVSAKVAALNAAYGDHAFDQSAAYAELLGGQWEWHGGLNAYVDAKNGDTAAQRAALLDGVIDMGHETWGGFWHYDAATGKVVNTEGQTQADLHTLLEQLQKHDPDANWHWESGKGAFVKDDMTQVSPDKVNLYAPNPEPGTEDAAKKLSDSMIGVGGSKAKSLAPTTVVDTSQWPVHSTTIFACKKIAAMEKMAAAGDKEGLQECNTTYKQNNKYYQAVIDAKAALLEQMDAKVTGDKPELEAPPAPPEPTAEPVGVTTEPVAGAIQADGWKQVGGQLGSNPGGVYLDPTGDKWYVKFPSNEAVARNEVLAAKLYELATGDHVCPHELVSMDGKVGSAHRWLDTEKFDPGSMDAKMAAQKDFAIHAWLANWDCIGTGGSYNLGIKDGEAIMLDPGGSLEYRAMGTPKGDAFGNTVPEWDSLRNPSINPETAKVFGSMTPAMLVESAKKLGQTPAISMRNLVDKYHGGTKEEKAALKHKLAERAFDIKHRMDELIPKMEEAKSEPVPAVATPESVAEPVAPKPDTETTNKTKEEVKLALPPPKTFPAAAKGAKWAVGYQKKHLALYNAALTGDPNKVLAVHTNPEAKHHHDAAVHEYKMQLLTAMQHGGIASPDWENAVNQATMADKKGASKVVVGKIDPAKFPPVPEFKTSHEDWKAANIAAAQQCLDLAAKGDIDGLNAAVTAAHPSELLKSWHMGLVSLVNEQLHPPPPMAEVSGTLKNVHKALPTIGIKDATAKVGRYALLGKASVAPSDVAISGKWVHPDWDHANQAYQSMSADTRNVLKSYTSTSSQTNEQLATGNVPPKVKKAATELSEKAVPLKEGTLLHRHHSFPMPGDSQKLLNSVGTVIQDPSIQSMSSNQNWGWPGSVRWTFTVGPGVKAMPAKLFSHYSGESEVLGVPGQRILVTKVTQVKPNLYEEGAILAEGILLPTEKWKA